MEAGPPQKCYERNTFSNDAGIVHLYLDYTSIVVLTTASVSLTGICKRNGLDKIAGEILVFFLKLSFLID